VHPLLERIQEYNFLSKEKLFEKYNLEKGKEILLLLAGSREHEVKSIFPEVIKAAAKTANEFDMQIVAACSSNIDENVFKGLTEIKNFTVIRGHTYDLLKHSKFGIIKSGTSTLEAGLFELPMVIVYKTSLLTYAIGRRLIKVDRIGMVNIISGQKIVPELIQSEVNENSIYNECRAILADSNNYNSIKQKLGLIKEKLGTEGASARAASLINKVMNET